MFPPAACACAPSPARSTAWPTAAERCGIRARSLENRRAGAATPSKQAGCTGLFDIMKAHFAHAVREARHRPVAARSMSSARPVTLKHNNLHARFRNLSRESQSTMLPTETIRLLARRLYEARKSRTQLRHFSTEHPRHDHRGRICHPKRMGQDGNRGRPQRQGPQDRPHVARHAAGIADHRARLCAADGRHVLRDRQRHTLRAIHRAARGSGAGVRTAAHRSRGRA